MRAADESVSGIESTLATIDQVEAGRVRIKELKAEERSLAAEYEELERELYLLEQFIRSKVSMLEERINSRFELARFKMFKVLVNGGLEECCEVTYKGVPYSATLNHGARVLVGMDIVRTLQNHFGFFPPVWVDIGCQIIRLAVSDEMADLHVDVIE